MNQDKVWQAEEELREALGIENLLDSLERALGTETLEDMLAYIARVSDVKLSVDIHERDNY